MARVFISYAEEDLRAAKTIFGWLRDEGHEVFLAQHRTAGIQFGEDWKRRLHRELRAADAVVCVVTAAYRSSEWCAAEVGIADMLGRVLLPVRAEPGVQSVLLDPLHYTEFAGDAGRAREDLVWRLRQVDAAGGPGWADGRSPFPGLRHFNATMAQVFCGRSEEIRQLTGRLRSLGERAEGGLLLVVGPSGCGKSSLVRAGLPAPMAAASGWKMAEPFVPGAHPVSALGWALTSTARKAGLEWPPLYADSELDKGHDGLERLARELLAAGRGSVREWLLLVVDQGDELLTRSTDSERVAFIELLRRGLAGPVRAVITLRSEFQDRLLALPGLAGVKPDVLPLRPLDRRMLRQVIEKPADVAGLGVDPDLVERLVDDTVDGEALPLLAFTLNRLADGLTCGDSLSADRYDELGGVRGALARHADDVLTAAAKAGELTPAQVLAGLRRLATLDSSGKPTRRRIRLGELDEPLRAAFRAFVDKRLLTTSQEGDGVWVGVAHEALLTEWPTLKAMLDERAAVLRAARDVEAAAAQWGGEGESEHYLWGAKRLDATVAAIGLSSAPLGDKHAATGLTAAIDEFEDLNDAGRRFLRACIDRARAARLREQRLRRYSLSILSALLALSVALTLVSVLLANGQRKQADTAQRTTAAVQLAAEADAVRAGNPRLALQLGIAAYQLGMDQVTDQTIAASAAAGILETLTTLHPLGRPVAGHANAVWSVAFSPDGRTLATGSADTTVRLWDIADPARPRPLGGPLEGHTDAVRSVVFSPDGGMLATGSADTTVRLWDIADPARPRPLGGPLEGHTDAVWSVAFSPDGRTLATGSSDETARLWDIADPARPRPFGGSLREHGNFVLSVAFSPDGQTLATGSADTTARLWDIADPADPRHLGEPLRGHGDVVILVAFSADGSTLAAGSADNTALLWDVSDRARPRSLGDPLAGHTSTVWSMAFSPDGRTLAAGGDDNAARLWNGADSARSRPLGEPLRGHASPVLSMAFSTDGALLATGSGDTAVRLWDVSAIVDLRSHLVERACAAAGTGLDQRNWEIYAPGVPYRQTCPHT